MRYSSDMGGDVQDPYLETPEVLRLCKLPYSTLDSWVRSGLVSPSVRGGTGHRRTRLWSVRDVVTVRALKELREAGAPVRLLAKAQRVLEDDWTINLRDRMLYWDGGDIVRLDEWSNLISLVRAPGQAVLRIVAVPLDSLRDEAEEVATMTTAAAAAPSSPRPARSMRRTA